MIVALPMRRAILVSLSCLLVASSVRAAVVAEIKAFTRPSEQRKLSFSTPGVVQQVPVKEGQIVKVGDVLIVLDGDVEKKELQRMKTEAESTARIQAAQADLKVKQSTLKRKTSAGEGAYPISEIEEAEADVTLREKQLVVAQEEQQQNQLKYQAEQTKVEKMNLRSPIDGIVQRIVVREGEWADPQSREGVLVVVKNDVLDVELYLRPELARLLAAGEKIQVQYLDEKTEWLDAEVYFFDPLVDSGSGEQLVKAKLMNPTNRTAGMQVRVKLPQKLVDAQAAADQNSALRK